MHKGFLLLFNIRMFNRMDIQAEHWGNEDHLVGLMVFCFFVGLSPGSLLFGNGRLWGSMFCFMSRASLALSRL